MLRETRQDEQGFYRPGSVIWLVRGNRIIKAAPQQLRRASQREECVEELLRPPNLPWTLTKLTEDLGARQYEDATRDLPSLQEIEQGRDEESLGPQVKRVRLREKGRFPVVESSEGGVSVGGASGSRERGPEPVEDDMDASFGEAGFWVESNNPAVEISFEVPTSYRGKKQFCENLESFLVSNLRRRAVEVSERSLDEEELKQMREAKQSEVKKFIGAEALEVLPKHLQPCRSLAMRMRWILTWKRDENDQRKAKARCVVLGYMDPKYAERQVAAPTMSRTTRQLLLAISAAKKFTIHKGDVSGAFLQGRQYNDTSYVIPTDEICAALNIEPGSVTKLRKACYGLVDAPLEWFLTVSDYLISLGFERCVSDPCCFKLLGEHGLIGLISGHVDDFLFCGPKNNQQWNEICRKIKEKFQWGTWETGKFVQCGVLVEETSDGGYELSQTQYIDDLKEIQIPSDRRKTPLAPTTDREKSRLRGSLGALSWCAQQTCPHVSAAVSLLLSQVTQSTVQTLIDTNKLVFKVKANRKHKMLVHGGMPLEQTLIAGWADAAGQNRVDGKSTEGIFVGLTTTNLLEGDMCRITPICWHSNKIVRQCRSPGAAESLAAIDCEDHLYSVRLQFHEMCGNKIRVRRTGTQVAQVPAVLVTDSTNVYDRMKPLIYVPKGPEKRIALEMVGLKEALEETKLPIRWVHGDAQLANSMTKEHEMQQLERFYHLGHRWRIVEDDNMTSAKNRRKQGLDVLADAGEGCGGHVNL